MAAAIATARCIDMAATKVASTNTGMTIKEAHTGTLPDRKLVSHVWVDLAPRPPQLRQPGVTRVRYALALLLFAFATSALRAQATTAHKAERDPTTAVSESPEAIASAQTASKPPAADTPKVSYVGGQLRINALDSTLAEVLAKVAALTGVKIDVPAGADKEPMPVVELGPGPAREILASLLSDSDFDYLIQASDKDPDLMQSVVLIPRAKKSGGPKGTIMAARQSSSPFARAATPPPEVAEAREPDTAVPAQPQNAAAEASSPNPQPAPTQPDQPMPLTPAQPAQSDFSKPAQLSPPATLNSQSINQQLQQMYQQRMQMVQQSPAGAAASGTTGGR